MDFALFLLVNATLFLRPAEIFPVVEAWPIYNWLIILALVAASPRIARTFATANTLLASPVTVCVIGVWGSIVLSHLARFDLYSARMDGYGFLKVVAYFLLLVAVVNTRQRLFTFLGAIAVLTILLAALAVAHYHRIIDLPALAAVEEYDVDEFTGEKSVTRRLCATGIFNDPNDLSMIIVASIGICGFGLVSRPLGVFRFCLIVPISFLGYGLALTHSRGGLLALMVGCSMLFAAHFGWKRACLAGCLVIPALLAIFRGRQTDFAGALSGGTGESRSELWSEGLQHFKLSPLTGIGCNRYAEEIGLVAHNSFVHCFTELGLAGGSMFLGVFLLVAYSLWRLRRIKHEFRSRSLRQMHPYLLALVVAYVVSMLSLSRSYVVPTYMVAGLGVVYERLARSGTSLRPLRFSSSVVRAIIVTSIGFIFVVYVYIQVALRWW